MPGPLTSPESSLRIDAASPPDFTAEVTIRANAHTEKTAAATTTTTIHL